MQQKTKKPYQASMSKAEWRKYRQPYLLILPAVLFVFIFAYLPMSGIVIAFKDFDILDGILKSPWVGLKNFKTIFTYPDMLLAIKNTLVYGVVILFLGFPFPILLALLFNEVKLTNVKKVFQTVSYMPYFLSWISVIGLFYSFFSLEGTFNSVMKMIFGAGYEPVNILMNEKFFLPILFTSHLWKNMGWSSVVYLACMAGIDPSMYEAARVDGCGRLKQVFYITLPSIKGTALVVFIMSLGSLFNTNFEQVLGFQNVYTQEATEVISTLIYRQGIQNGKYSLATAFGLMQGVVTIVILLTANAFTKKFADTSIW